MFFTDNLHTMPAQNKHIFLSDWQHVQTWVKNLIVDLFFFLIALVFSVKLKKNIVKFYKVASKKVSKY